MKTLLCGIMLLVVTHIASAQLQPSSFMFDGLSREYFVFLPQNFESDMPVVINLHGSMPDDAQWMINYTLMNNIADTAGFIAVYPQAIAPRWNANCSIPNITEPDVDDVGFISALIDTLNVHYDIDLDRIYCCGLNYGGWMASELICQIGNRFAAGARVNTSLGDSQAARCKLTRPFPMILFNGTADTYLPWPDGKTGVMGGEEAIEWWVERNGCNQDPGTIALPDLDATDNCTVEKISYLSCAGNAEVIFYKVINGGLSWPGAVGNEPWDKPRNMDINAGVEIWNFFKRFERSSVYIPDTTFLYALIDEGVDTDGDSLISYEEADAVTSLDLSGRLFEPGEITNMKGIEAFVNLNELNCSFNQITSLDVSNNTSLQLLICNNNPMTSLTILNNAALERIYCGNNLLTSLNGSSCTALKSLYCEDNELTSLNLSSNTALTELKCEENQLTILDLSNSSALEVLYCSDNQLTNIDVSNSVNLEFLECVINDLITLDVSKNTALKTLHCGTNKLTSLEVTNNLVLEGLGCEGNQLASLDVSNNTALQYLDIRSMATLYEVCVWDGFDTQIAETTDSPNVYFTTECSETNIVKNSRNSIRLYPNPTNNIITIESVTSDLFSVKVISLSGQLLSTDEMEGTTHQLDLSSFQKGIYFLTIRSKDFVTTRKIVKL